VATAPFAGTNCAGRVFILDRESWGDEHLFLTEIVAARTAMELDRAMLQHRAEQAAADRERIRLIRDLHDGLLQSLTAAGLQLEMASRRPGEEITPRLHVITALVKKEQQRIRSFVKEMRSPIRVTGNDVVLVPHLRQLVDDAAAEWSCATSLNVEPNDVSVSQALAHELSFIVSEGIANAVRHGRASKVEVLIRKAENRLNVTVRDNGQGFSSAAGSSEKNSVPVSTGPRSLLERVHELGGSFTASSSHNGVELEIGILMS